jgi:hypothetical protein
MGNNNAHGRFFERVMASNSMHRAYTNMSNINKHIIIKKAFNTWANDIKLSPHGREVLYKSLDIKTKTEFLENMNKVVAWLQRGIKTRPYALLVEIKIKNPDEIKSSAWLAGPVVRRFGRSPTLIIPIEITPSHKKVSEAIQLGIRDFVFVDDAMYSGLQATCIMSGMYKRLNNLGLDKTERPRLWIAAAFSSNYSTRRISQKYKQLGIRQLYSPMHLRVYSPGILYTPKIPSIVRRELDVLIQNNVGTTMSILPYKVPNHKSFGPVGLVKYLEHVVGIPPYKTIGMHS